MTQININPWRATLAVCLLALFCSTGALAATEKVLFAFPDQNNGNRDPIGNLVFDAQGNLYGGGGEGLTWGGVVFQLVDGQAGWNENVILSFQAYNQSFLGPSAGLILGPNGSLFGTTIATPGSGGPGNDGLVYQLTPTGNGFKPSVVYSLPGGDAGAWPNSLVLDAGGNLYGTAYYGGSSNPVCGNSGGGLMGCGTVFKLSPKTGGGWTFRRVHKFTGFGDGGNPVGGHLVLDAAGNLYGSAQVGGAGYCACGNVFKIAPDGTFTVLYEFHGHDGALGLNGLTFDSAGNLYGATGAGGSSRQGVIYRLIPKSDGTWSQQILYQFTGGNDGGGPSGELVFDDAGNLYGTTVRGGANSWGTVFKLTPQAQGQWSESVLHSFANGSDGATPVGSVIFDASGNLYGLTGGGGNTQGVVYEVTP